MRKNITSYLKLAIEYFIVWMLSVLSISTVMITVYLVTELFKLLFNPILKPLL
jgi:hypothetical protein